MPHKCWEWILPTLTDQPMYRRGPPFAEPHRDDQVASEFQSRLYLLRACRISPREALAHPRNLPSPQLRISEPQSIQHRPACAASLAIGDHGATGATIGIPTRWPSPARQGAGRSARGSWTGLEATRRIRALPGARGASADLGPDRPSFHPHAGPASFRNEVTKCKTTDGHWHHLPTEDKLRKFLAKIHGREKNQHKRRSRSFEQPAFHKISRPKRNVPDRNLVWPRPEPATAGLSDSLLRADR